MPATLDPQRAAILRLLDDDDVVTVRLVLHKLAETETAARLRELHSMAEGLAAERLHTLLVEMHGHSADTAFAGLCATFGEHGDLEEASWALAAVFEPGADFSAAREQLDAWGAALAERLTGKLDKAERVRVMAEYLGREQRLRGNDDKYYSVGNSLLPLVIETRLGIPISLSLVYMLAGQRAGMTVEGVGLPGHFLARHEDVFFDPFHGGRRISVEECTALMEQQNLALTPLHLAPTTSRQMLIRMLTNLYYVTDQVDPPQAAKVGEWIEMLREE